MEEQNLSEHLKQALKDEKSMEIFIWKTLVTQRKHTEAQYYSSHCHVNGTVMRDQCGFNISPTYIYNQGGLKKTDLRKHAIICFRETFRETTFEKAITELENGDIIYQEDDILHDSEDFDLPTFEKK